MNQTESGACHVSKNAKPGIKKRRSVPHESRWKTGTVGEAYGKMNEMRRGREAEAKSLEVRG